MKTFLKRAAAILLSAAVLFPTALASEAMGSQTDRHSSGAPSPQQGPAWLHRLGTAWPGVSPSYGVSTLRPARLPWTCRPWPKMESDSPFGKQPQRREARSRPAYGVQ